MEYTEAIRRAIEECLIDIESEMKNSITRIGNEREEIFADIKRKLNEVYQVLPNIFNQSIEELGDLTNMVDKSALDREQGALNAILREIEDKMQELGATGKDEMVGENIITLRNHLLSVIEEKETSINPINGKTRENGYFKEYLENIEEIVQIFKNGLERAEDFMDIDTLMFASQRLNEIKMRAEELVNLEEKSQKDLSETVLVRLQELEKKVTILIEQSDVEQSDVEQSDIGQVEQKGKSKDPQRTIEVDGNTIAILQEAEQRVRDLTIEANDRIKGLQDMLEQLDITDAQKENLQAFLESMLKVRNEIESALISLNQGNTILGISTPLDKQESLEGIGPEGGTNIEKGIQLEEEEKLQSPQEVEIVYEDLRKRIQALGGLQSAGRHVRTIRSIERDIARLEDFLANSSNLGIDLNGLKQTLDTVKAELTLKQDSVDRNPYEPEKGASVEQNTKNSTRKYRRNRPQEGYDLHSLFGG